MYVRCMVTLNPGTLAYGNQYCLTVRLHFLCHHNATICVDHCTKRQWHVIRMSVAKPDGRVSGQNAAIHSMLAQRGKKNGSSVGAYTALDLTRLCLPFDPLTRQGIAARAGINCSKFHELEAAHARSPSHYSFFQGEDSFTSFIKLSLPWWRP